MLLLQFAIASIWLLLYYYNCMEQNRLYTFFQKEGKLYNFQSEIMSNLPSGTEDIPQNIRTEGRNFSLNMKYHSHKPFFSETKSDYLFELSNDSSRMQSLFCLGALMWTYHAHLKNIHKCAYV